MLTRPVFSLLCLTCAGPALNVAAEDVPGWLREASTRKVPEYGAKVPAVVLLDEAHAIVDETGRVTTSRRYAVRILSLEGRNEAQASFIYLLGSAKVREMRAWLISPSGELLKLGKETEYDRAYSANDLYNDIRQRGCNAHAKADPGSVFGYESAIEERPPFAQFVWRFQWRLPVLVSRYVLTLPIGWRFDAFVYNHPEVAPIADGSTSTWDVRNLPFIEPEPSGPHLDSLAPRLALTYYPGANAKPQSVLSFSTWSAVSRWLSGLNDPPSEPDAEIAAKAKELVASARSEFQRIQAIGYFVRHIKYVSIQTGLGRGGGFRPHAAADVFRNDYGDCKDKASLTRAMLKAVGIQSYALFVNTNDRGYVREQWPSPEQFNHAIVAVKVSTETNAPAIVEHPAFGRLLAFDPTNGNTPVGELPMYEQGGLGLLGAGEAGALVRLPMSQPIANLVAREIRASISDAGTLTASIREETHGQAAIGERQQYYGRTRPDYDKIIERSVARYATAGVLSKLNVADQGSRFTLTFDMEAPGYGQMKADRLMVFKPVLLGRREAEFLTDPKRNYPVLLNPSLFRENIHIKLPQNFKPDELPDPVKLQSPFGEYTARCELTNGELVFARTMEVRAVSVPPEQYQELRKFYQKILAEEQSVVVLERQ
jgi:transglutaminase-like putative cysteine protease